MNPANDQTTARAPYGSLEFFVPIKTVNELNDHSHWRNRQRRARAQHHAIASVLLSLQLERPELPCRVTLTRVSRGTLDDDGLVASGKHARDAIAKWLGVDDRHRDIVRYEYEQRHGKDVGLWVAIKPMESKVAV